MNFFSGHQGKPFLQIKSKLIAKNTLGTSAGAICFMIAGI